MGEAAVTATVTATVTVTANQTLGIPQVSRVWFPLLNTVNPNNYFVTRLHKNILMMFLNVLSLHKIKITFAVALNNLNVIL